MLIVYYVIYWWDFDSSINIFILSMLESHSWKCEIVAKIWRLKRSWYLSKLLPFTINFNFGHFFSCPVKFKIVWNRIWIKIHQKPWYLTKTLKTFKTSKILLLWKLLIAQSNKRMLFCFWRQRPILLLNLVKEQVIEVSNLNKIYRTVVIICTHCDIEKLSRGFLKSRYSKHFETFVMLALPKTIRKQSYKFIEGQ